MRLYQERYMRMIRSWLYVGYYNKLSLQNR